MLLSEANLMFNVITFGVIGNTFGVSRISFGFPIFAAKLIKHIFAFSLLSANFR